MRIAFYSPRTEYLDPGFTGDHVFVRALLDGLDRRGHEVRVASRLRPEDLSARKLPARALLTEARAVRQEMVRFDPDAWLVYAPTSAHPDLFGWRSNPKRYVLFAADAGDPGGVPERWGPLFGRAHRRSLRRADAVTTYRPTRARHLEAAGVTADRLRVLPLAVRPWDVVPTREAARRRLGLPADATVVLCVTRLSKPRGTGPKPWKTEMVLEVLNAAARLPPDVVLVVVGDGRGRPVVEARVAELGLAPGGRVRLAGAADHADLAWYYAACDLFAMPTLRDFPWLAVLEAQACGRPVVTTRTPSSELTVADGTTGLLSRDLEEFGHDLARLAADAELRRTLGGAGPAYVAAHHTIETRVGQVERMLCGESSVRPAGERPPGMACGGYEEGRGQRAEGSRQNRRHWSALRPRPSALFHAASQELRFRMEEAWLRRLPLLTRDYLWVDADGGLRVFGSTRYKRFLYRLMKGYERYTVRLFEEAVRPGMTVLDVGAHIGYYSLVAGRKLAGRGRVYAFECDPGNYRFLRHNVRLNGFARTVVPVPKAVAERAGTQTFYVRGGEATQGSLWSGRKAAESIVVECVAADQVVGDAAVDVIKMDVEGGEVHALRGMRRALSRAGRMTMFVECNPSALAAAGSTPEELLAEVSGLGFRTQVIDEGGRSLGAVTDDLHDPRHRDDEKHFVNLCCTRDG